MGIWARGLYFDHKSLRIYCEDGMKYLNNFLFITKHPCLMLIDLCNRMDEIINHFLFIPNHPCLMLIDLCNLTQKSRTTYGFKVLSFTNKLSKTFAMLISFQNVNQNIEWGIYWKIC